MPVTVVGRDEVLDRARAVMGDAGRLVIEGPAGIGKTALLEALLGDAEDRGRLVLRCAPSESEAGLPFAALGDLLAPLVGHLAGLPAPQQHAAQSALLLVADSAPVDERALAAATLGLLEAAADHHGPGIVVSVDDTPWLDPPSERALRFALRRVSARVQVVATMRSGIGAELEVPLELDARAPVERLHLSPLGVGPLHRVITLRFGVSLSRSMITRLVRESGGNPLLAIELTRAVLRADTLPGPGEDLPVPTSLQELVDASIATLPPDSLRAVRVAALLSSPHLPDLAAAGVAAESLDAVEEVGLVTVDDSARVRFAHPTYASAVRASIPAGVQRRLHRVLAESSPDPDERARHLAQYPTGTDDDVATVLAAAAARARARGAPDLGAEFYERAAELSSSTSTADTYRLRALYCSYDCGNYATVAQQVETLARGLEGDLLAEALLLRATIAFGLDDLSLAAATAEQALLVATPSSRLAGQILASLASFNDGAKTALDHAVGALAVLDVPAGADPDTGDNLFGGTDHELLASVLMLVFLNEVRTGMPPRLDLLDRALDLEADSPSRPAGTVAAIWWKQTDQHDRARERLQSMLDTAVAAGDQPLQHDLLEHLAEAETLAGNYELAAEWIAAARELATQLGAGVAAERWLDGTLHAHLGRLADARAAAEEGLAEAEASDDLWLRRISLLLLAFTALAEGRPDEAATAYAELAAAGDATGMVEPLGSRFEPDWLEACVGVGDLATADTVLERLARRHARLPRPWTTLGLARSRVLLAGARGDDTANLVTELLAARSAVPPDVIPFDRARCLLVAGLAHRRARRRGAAREALLAAADEFAALGARSFAARAREEADRTGGRTAGPDALSSSELRMAELAATGATNREIADALFVAPKTVEANLARAYRKLGIGRRAELSAALDARKGDPTEGFT